VHKERRFFAVAEEFRGIAVWAKCEFRLRLRRDDIIVLVLLDFAGDLPVRQIEDIHISIRLLPSK
jgi:hypothetical protein